MTTNWTDRLSEYLDGTLTPEEQSACEAWLASDAEGRELLADLRRVVAKAKTLPDVAVPESVWRGVAAGIRATATTKSGGAGVIDLGTVRSEGRTTRRWNVSPMQLAAAAIILLAVGVTAGILYRPRREGPGGVALNPGHPPVTTGVRTTTVVASRANESYDRAVGELQSILDHNRSTLDTATVRVLESSLAKIDAALAQAQEALSKDPRNAYLIDHLTRIKRKKLDLLRQGASLVQAS